MAAEDWHSRVIGLRSQDEKWKVRIAGIGMFVHGNGFGMVDYSRTRDQAPVLPGEGEQMHTYGWDAGCVCRVVTGCM